MSIYEHIIRWNQEFIDSYKPGTQNSINVASRIWPHETEDDAAKKYRREWEHGEIKSRMTINLPDHGQEGRICLRFQRIPAGRLAQFEFGSGQWSIIVSPSAWRGSSFSQKRKALEHELEHAVDFIRVQNYDEDPEPCETTDWDGTNLGRRLHGGKRQEQYYIAMFGEGEHVPQWANDLADSSNKEFWSRIIDWGADRAEQRAEIKRFLKDKPNQEMTESLWTRLCNAKARAGNIEWSLSPNTDRFPIHLGVLLHLNCTAIDDNAIEAANSIAKIDTGEKMNRRELRSIVSESRVIKISQKNLIRIIREELASFL